MLKDDDDIYHFINLVCGESLTWKIVRVLAKSNGLTLRELARRCSVSPKTLYKHLNSLREKGVIEIHRPGPRVFLIKLHDRYHWLRDTK
ncbi:MAG: winged helix-turn-helix domain-containing protein [Pyrobaculum sp.]